GRIAPQDLQHALASHHGRLVAGRAPGGETRQQGGQENEAYRNARFHGVFDPKLDSLRPAGSARRPPVSCKRAGRSVRSSWLLPSTETPRRGFAAFLLKEETVSCCPRTGYPTRSRPRVKGRWK